MLRERIRLKGISPERALTRLSRLGVGIYAAQKTDKTTVEFWIKKSDLDKVYAIYPKGSVYAVERLPARGGTRTLEWLRRRTGVLLGGLLFLAITCAADGVVLRIEVDAPTVYEAKVQALLKEKGVKKYVAYQKDKEDEICASLLALDGVSYCSMQKRGSVLIVTIKTNAFYTPPSKEELYAERSGVVERIVLLSGTALVEKGAVVAKGDKLVEGAIYSPEGEKQETSVVAYATLSCRYEAVYACADENEAFAKAYLEAGLEEDKGKLVQAKVEKTGEGYAVSLSYTWTQRLKI